MGSFIRFTELLLLCLALCGGHRGDQDNSKPCPPGLPGQCTRYSATQGVRAGVGKKHYTVVSNKTLCWAWGTQQ